MADVDWKKARKEYITSNVSQRELAKKYGVSRSAVEKVATRQGWTELRKKQMAKFDELVVQKSAEAQADKLMRIGEAAGRALDVAMSALEDEKQFNRYIISEGIGGGATETSEREFTKVDTKALRDLTNVIKELTGIFRNVYGLPTQQEAEAQRVAAERLEMDKAKANEGRTDDAIKVIISGEAEDWAK